MGKRTSVEQTIKVLRQIEVLQSQGGTVAGALVVVVLLAIHLPTDFLNLGRIVRGSQEKSKVFSYWGRVKNNPEKEVNLAFHQSEIANQSSARYDPARKMK